VPPAVPDTEVAPLVSNNLIADYLCTYYFYPEGFKENFGIMVEAMETKWMLCYYMAIACNGSGIGNGTVGISSKT